MLNIQPKSQDSSSSHSYINTNANSSVLNNNLLLKTTLTNSQTTANKKMRDCNVQAYLASQYGNTMPSMHHIQNFYPQQQATEAQQTTTSNNIKMDLEDKDLWTRFYNVTNEMILTRAGRRTFPLVKIRMAGLDESSLYTIQIEFRISDSFKYRFVNGEWRTSPRNDSIRSTQQAILYEHSDSPNFGHHWNKDVVAFAKLKLTNNENTKNADSVFLRSLNKYDPIIHVYRHDKKNVDDKILVFSHFFKETQFIAVTAYQNEQITNLKIKHNPFAKAFLNNKPMITIDSNDNVIITPPSPSKDRSNSADSTKEPSKQENEVKQVNQPERQHQIINPAFNHNELLLQNSLQMSVKNIYANQDFIQNWYTNYYPIAQTNKPPQLAAYNSQPAYDAFHPYPIKTQIAYNGQCLNNDYLYNNHYQQQYQSQHHSLTANNYNDQVNNYNNSGVAYHQHQFDYNLPSNESYQYMNDRTESKQSSPIYDLYSKNIIPPGAKKSNHQMSLKEHRSAPYTTARPSKRNTPPNVTANDITNSLSVSPVYGLCGTNTILKQEYNESDDSLNLTENFLSQLHNQSASIQSITNSTASSFTLSSSNASA